MQRFRRCPVGRRVGRLHPTAEKSFHVPDPARILVTGRAGDGGDHQLGAGEVAQLGTRRPAQAVEPATLASRQANGATSWRTRLRSATQCQVGGGEQSQRGGVPTARGPVGPRSLVMFHDQRFDNGGMAVGSDSCSPPPAPTSAPELTSCCDHHWSVA